MSETIIHKEVKTIQSFKSWSDHATPLQKWFLILEIISSSQTPLPFFFGLILTTLPMDATVSQVPEGLTLAPLFPALEF
jgi:hypothetical protein